MSIIPATVNLRLCLANGEFATRMDVADSRSTYQLGNALISLCDDNDKDFAGSTHLGHK